MILGILLLLGGGVCLVMALHGLRGIRDPDWVRAEETRLLISPAPGQDEPRILLRRGDGVAFGPHPATWNPPKGMAGVPVPVAGGGRYRVAAAVDLGAEDALGVADARLATMLRGTLGSSALVLLPEAGDRPILLHGTKRGAQGSAVGVGMEQKHLDALISLLGDPAGLRVTVERRRVQRAGWGGAQGQRHRARQ